MNLVMILSFCMIPVLSSWFAGLIATSANRNFWFWFWISMPFPFIAHCILIFLGHNEEVRKPLRAV